MKKYLIALLFSVCLVSLVSGADPVQDRRTITVNGEGSVAVVPDVAFLNLAVVTEAETVSKAMTSNKVAMNAVFSVLTKAEVLEKDICTHGFNVSPKYKYVKDDEPKLVGYVVKNEVKVTVKNIDKTGTLLDSVAVDEKANFVSGVTFDVLDKTKVLNEARKGAVEDALKRANLLATASGVKLGKVVTIQEHGTSSSNYTSVSRMSDATPLAKGEQSFRSSVTLVITLVD